MTRVGPSRRSLAETLIAPFPPVQFELGVGKGYAATGLFYPGADDQSAAVQAAGR